VPGAGLDVLVLDMPPGTGDVPLTLGQLVHVHGSSHIFHLVTMLTDVHMSAGSVIVSTPQSVALDDVRKGLSTFSKLSIPVRSLFLYPNPPPPL
jgi:ATP-binding protein involved in chromosome partitioning